MEEKTCKHGLIGKEKGESKSQFFNSRVFIELSHHGLLNIA